MQKGSSGFDDLRCLQDLGDVHGEGTHLDPPFVLDSWKRVIDELSYSRVAGDFDQDHLVFVIFFNHEPIATVELLLGLAFLALVLLFISTLLLSCAPVASWFILVGSRFLTSRGKCRLGFFFRH